MIQTRARRREKREVWSSQTGVPWLFCNVGECFLSAPREAGERVPSEWPDNCVTKGDVPAF